MRFSPQNQNDRTGAFDIELEGFGRIAHVDPFGADDPIAFRDLLCATPDMLAVLKSALPALQAYRSRLIIADESDLVRLANGLISDVRAAIAKAEGRS